MPKTAQTGEQDSSMNIPKTSAQRARDVLGLNRRKHVNAMRTVEQEVEAYLSDIPTDDAISSLAFWAVSTLL